MPRMLIVDDEKDVHYSFRRMLRKESDLELLSAGSGEEALTLLEHHHDLDVIIMDIRMGGISGLEVLRQIQSRDIRSKPLVIMMTAFSSADAAIEATKLGAFDYVIKPFDVEKMKNLVQEALHARQAMRRVVTLEETEPEDIGDADRIIGRHSSMQNVFKMIGRVAPTDATVLIQGESGTGKELVARAIYHHSERKDKVFLPLNCAAIPEHLLESELFGHEKGAFTSAVERRIGKFEQCDGGTLFLDEIGDISLALQGKLLRLLEDGAFQRLGGNRWIETDVRILAATNRDLESMVERANFRSDLFYRLNVVSISLPPLRERREDIPALINFFVKRSASEYGRSIKGLSDAALHRLTNYDWPGNVRQLENAVKRALVVSRGDLLLKDDFLLRDSEPKERSAQVLPSETEVREESRKEEEILADYFFQVATDPPSGGILPSIERSLVRLAIEHTGGNQVQASKLLGISRNTLRARLKELETLDNE